MVLTAVARWCCPVLADKSIHVALRGWFIRVVQPTQDRDGAHTAGQRRARHTPFAAIGHPLPQALMRPRGVEVRDVLPEDPAQLGLAQDEHLVQALAPHAAQEPRAGGVLPGRAILSGVKGKRPLVAIRTAC